jgi:hypothetical protein
MWSVGRVAADDDPVAVLRVALRRLYEQVRRPTYRQLQTYASREGLALATSTTGTVLNGPGPHFPLLVVT